LASGGGYYLIAVITLVLALVTLTALGTLERCILRKGRDDET